MAIHDREPVTYSHGLMCWPCACGRRFYSAAGIKRHLTVTPGRDIQPWAFINRRGA